MTFSQHFKLYCTFSTNFTPSYHYPCLYRPRYCMQLCIAQAIWSDDLAATETTKSFVDIRTVVRQFMVQFVIAFCAQVPRPGLIVPVEIALSLHCVVTNIQRELWLPNTRDLWRFVCPAGTLVIHCWQRRWSAVGITRDNTIFYRIIHSRLWSVLAKPGPPRVTRTSTSRTVVVLYESGTAHNE